MSCATSSVPPASTRPRSVLEHGVDVEDLLKRSFGRGAETIRRMFADSIAGDTMGLTTRRENGRVGFTYRNVVLTGTR